MAALQSPCTWKPRKSAFPLQPSHAFSSNKLETPRSQNGYLSAIPCMYPPELPHRTINLAKNRSKYRTPSLRYPPSSPLWSTPPPTVDLDPSQTRLLIGQTQLHRSHYREVSFVYESPLKDAHGLHSKNGLVAEFQAGQYHADDHVHVGKCCPPRTRSGRRLQPQGSQRPCHTSFGVFEHGPVSIGPVGLSAFARESSVSRNFERGGGRIARDVW